MAVRRPPRPHTPNRGTTAISILWDMGSQARVTDFVKQFAAMDLYERVRADMVVTGVLQRTTRRRFGLSRKETYLAVDTARRYASVADSVTPSPTSRRTPTGNSPITALERTPRLNPTNTSDSQRQQWMDHITGTQPDDAIRAVATVDPTVDATYSTATNRIATRPATACGFAAPKCRTAT
jgi:hypothetical protein